MYEGVSSVLASLRDADLDAAKKKLETMAGEARTERERGSILAATGIFNSMVKSKEGAMQTWDSGRMSRAVQSIRGSQMADEFDAGYAETISNYLKLSPQMEETKSA